MYKYTSAGSIVRLSDGAAIPSDTRNLDYQAWQRWVEAGGVTLPADPVETTSVRVDAWQMAQALIALGLIDDVEAAVAASTDPLVKYGWSKALYFVRTDPLVVSMGAALGKTDAELDALFALAETL